jgi:hypothetical protein
MNALEDSLASIDASATLVRNTRDGDGIHYETSNTGPLADSEREALVRAAASFWHRGSTLRELTGVANRADDLGKALDHIGVMDDVSDPKTDAARAKVLDELVALAAIDGVHVYTARLPDEDMSWNNLLVVVDEKNQDILLESGGFGN